MEAGFDGVGGVFLVGAVARGLVAGFRRDAEVAGVDGFDLGFVVPLAGVGFEAAVDFAFPPPPAGRTVDEDDDVETVVGVGAVADLGVAGFVAAAGVVVVDDGEDDFSPSGVETGAAGANQLVILHQGASSAGAFALLTSEPPEDDE